MAAANTITAAAMIDQLRFELRDTDNTQWTDVELLNYINVCLELLHNLLIDSDAELVRTGTGTITTVSGTETYSLTTNTMGDLWAPHMVWISGYDPLELVDHEQRLPYMDTDGSLDTGQPTEFYLLGDNLGLLPEPDDAYTINLTYYPNFVEIDAATDTMPLLNLFNMQIREAVKVYAKNREGLNIGIEASLMQIFQDRALAIMRRRRPVNLQMKVRF